MTTVQTYQHKLLLAKQMLIRTSVLDMADRESENDYDARSDEVNYESQQDSMEKADDPENRKLLEEDSNEVGNNINTDLGRIDELIDDKREIKKEKMDVCYGDRVVEEREGAREEGMESDEEKEEMPDLIMHSRMQQIRPPFMSADAMERFYKSLQHMHNNPFNNPFNNFNDKLVASMTPNNNSNYNNNNTYENNNNYNNHNTYDNTLNNKSEMFSKVGKMEFGEGGDDGGEMGRALKKGEEGRDGASRNIFCCHICSFVGSSEQDFNSHMSQHFEHQCPHCTYSSRTEGRLKRHIKDFHNSESDDPSCQHKAKVSSPKRTCRYCKFYTYDQVEFWLHLKKHIKPEKLLECPHCEFVTELKHHLEYHIRVHIGSKPYKCTKCNYSCVNKSMLNSHMKSHTNVYQFRCKDCNYATKYSHSLKLHLFKKNHQADVVLNSDGSLPTTAPQHHNSPLDNSKRGPPRGPRLSKRKLEEGYDHKSSEAFNNNNNNNYFNFLYEKQRILAHPETYNNHNNFPRSSSFELPYLWRDTFKSRSPSELSSASREDHFDAGYNYKMFGGPKRPTSPNQLLQQLYNKPFVPAYVCRLCSERFALPHLLKQHLEEVHLKEVKLFNNLNHLNKTFNNDNNNNNSNLIFHNNNFNHHNNNNLYLEKPKLSPLSLVPSYVKQSELKEEKDIEKTSNQQHNNNKQDLSSNDNLYYQDSKQSEHKEVCKEKKTLSSAAALDLSTKTSDTDRLDDNSDSFSKFNDVPDDNDLPTLEDNLPKSENIQVPSSNRRRMRKGVAFKVNATLNEEEDEEENEKEDVYNNSKVDEAAAEVSKTTLISGESPSLSDLCSSASDEGVKEGTLKVDSTWHMCTHCEMAFADQLTHRLHMGYHGYQNAFQCNGCGQKCLDAFDFMLHLMCKAHN